MTEIMIPKPGSILSLLAKKTAHSDNVIFDYPESMVFFLNIFDKGHVYVRPCNNPKINISTPNRSKNINNLICHTI